MFSIEIDGEDVVVRNVVVTCFGGAYDKGDNGQTESGVKNDGSNPNLIGCALPIRSTEKATAGSPLACSFLPHIPWGTKVEFWGGIVSEAMPLPCDLIDNGPNVLKYPTHAGDLTPIAALHFSPHLEIEEIANEFEAILSYRVIGGSQYLSVK